MLVGGVLWYFAGTLPGCSIDVAERLPSPDGRFNLVVFSRACGGSDGPNTQAALIPAGEDLPEDAASFVSIGMRAELEPRWTSASTIELSVPRQARIYRQDESVAGVGVAYR